MCALFRKNIAMEQHHFVMWKNKPKHLKVMFRIIPFIFLAYLLNIVDRINISFAKLRMSEDLLLSDAAYGMGTSLFSHWLFDF